MTRHPGDYLDRRMGRGRQCYGYCDQTPCKCPRDIRRAMKKSARQTARALILAALAAGCSRTPPPEKPKTHTINAELACFVVESERGAGLVCTEYGNACLALQRLTAAANGVTAISECRKAQVVADVKE